MRITKEQLKQIIKEELKAVQQESDWYSDEHETLADKKFADSQRDPTEEFFRNYGLEPDEDGKIFIPYDRDDWKEIIYQIDGDLEYEPRDDLGGMMVTVPRGA